jgi:hypothetical protein
MKNKTKEILYIVLPLSFFLSFLFQQKWHSKSVMDWPNLYGLFYPISSDAIGSSFNYEYYIKGLLIALIIFGTISYLFNSFVLQKIKNWFIKKGIIILIWIGFSLLVLPRILFINYAVFKWDYNHTSIFLSKTWLFF